MSDHFDLLAQKLFNKPSLDACSVDELSHLTQQYPYFAPAQILFLKKLNVTPAYEQQYQKAILYHHDPLTFNNLLHPEKYNTDFIWNESEVEVVEELAIPAPASPVIYQEEPTEQQLTNAEQTPKEITTETEEIIVGEENHIPSEPVIETEQLKIQLQESSIAEPSAAPQREAEQPAKELLFEPYHTVDYFASQGIKLSKEEATSDRFSKQLKSFTEWLKVMKRLPVSERAMQTDTAGEKRVENLAQHSVKDSDIITEAMAEVWVKQGNKEKAAEVYRKLGLLNPSKRAYFAAKIEELTK